MEITENTMYNKVAWDIMIVNDTARLNNANIFIGPSYVKGGIDDSIMSVRGIKSVNMGINRAGFDIDHYWVKRITEKSHPKMIFLYRPVDRGTVLHPMVPLLYSPLEYLREFRQFPVDFIFKYIPKRLYFVFRHLFIRLSFQKKKFDFPRYGFHEENEYNIPSLLYDDAVLSSEMSIRKEYGKNGINDDGTLITENRFEAWWQKFYKGTAEPMRTKTMNFLNRRHIPASEIYVPKYFDAIIDEKTNVRSHFRKPVQYKYPCLTFNNFSFLADAALWTDLHHVNRIGATILTDSLCNYIK